MFTVGGGASAPKDVPLAVAETKYQELLDWAKSLPLEMLRGTSNASHVFFFQ
jgi:hypothetical protein